MDTGEHRMQIKNATLSFDWGIKRTIEKGTIKAVKWKILKISMSVFMFLFGPLFGRVAPNRLGC